MVPKIALEDEFTSGNPQVYVEFDLKFQESDGVWSIDWLKGKVTGNMFFTIKIGFL